MSANLLVDLQACQLYPSLVSGTAFSSSGVVVGQSCNLNNANTACNLLVAGIPGNTSGQLRIAVQCSDTDVSGTYTDPTSGLAQMPGLFTSGGVLTINVSGGGGFLASGIGVSGMVTASGFAVGSLFQRPTQFARAIMLSGGFYVGTLTACFVSQFRTTGNFLSGGTGGFSYSPQTGVVNV